MIQALALITFVLADGSAATQLIFPPGGDYHNQFAPMCERNRQRISDQVRGMVTRNEIVQPDRSVGIGRIRVYCFETTKV